MKFQSLNQKLIRRLIKTTFIFFGLLLLAISCSDTANQNEAVAEGNELFQSYCVICHGKYADGRGNMADRLNTPPMDLTTIAKRRGGNFPKEVIFNIIAGKDNVPGHSVGTDMPAWWDTLKKSEDISNDKEVRQKIEHIVAYLKEIQKS
ncbi:MAG: cytochrome c [Bacteroidota bacterium]